MVRNLHIVSTSSTSIPLSPPVVTNRCASPQPLPACLPLPLPVSSPQAEFLYTLLSAGSEFWYERQCRQQEEGSSPDNMLFGDLR